MGATFISWDLYALSKESLPQTRLAAGQRCWASPDDDDDDDDDDDGDADADSDDDDGLGPHSFRANSIECVLLWDASLRDSFLSFHGVAYNLLGC